ncbi:alanine racemase [Roseovarius aestuarii]|nr:alanine racemase [Roseovarius aestuarii]
MIEAQTEAMPILTEMCSDFLHNEQKRISELMGCFGSPLHVLFPQQAAENVVIWKSKIASVYPRLVVQYAFKACKSISLAQAFASEGAGADVSSVEEFVSAMRCGFAADDISVTGPDKPSSLLDLAITHGATVHIDSEEELGRILVMQGAAKKQVKLFIRIRKQGSRFGLDRQEIMQAFETLGTNGYSEVGLSFHLGGYSLEDRVAALSDACDVASQATEFAVRVGSIDIGGGFPVRYLTVHSIAAFSKGLHLSGKPEIDNYPYAACVASHDHAQAITEKTLLDPDLRSFFEEHKLEIRLQPGRSLLEHCGLTLMRVISVKPKDEHSSYVVLEGMSFSVSDRWFGSDFAPAPLLLKTNTVRRAEPHDYYLVGQSCLESDVIRNKAVSWHQNPSPGDIVCFANTAGYQMDSNESPFHQIPLPEKVAVLRSAQGWASYRDSNCNVRVESYDHQITN